MKSIYYSVPATLQREKEILEAKCDILIEAFNQLCKEEEVRIKKERQKAINSIEWNYSIKEIEGGWRILYKCAANPVEGYDNEGWSKPFKIVNGVLFYAEFYHKQKGYISADKLIPQGIFDESTLESINKGW